MNSTYHKKFSAVFRDFIIAYQIIFSKHEILEPNYLLQDSTNFYNILNVKP